MQKRNSNEGGFTLLELILALTITALITVMLFSALRLGHRSQEKGAEVDAVSQHMRILNDRLTWLFRGAYPFTLNIEGEETLQFTGGKSSIGFVTTSTDSYSVSPEDMAGLKWVNIFVDNKGLRLRESIFFMKNELETEGEEEAEEEEEGEEKSFIIDPTVTKISFKYLNLGNEEEIEGEGEGEAEVGWVETWDTEENNYLPAAIRAELTITIEGKDFELPPVVAKVRAGFSPFMVEE